MATITRNWRRIVGVVLGVLLLAWLVIQLIPLSRDNPAIVSEPAWDSPQTHALAQRACFDCHSNETVWPWYARISPVKLLIWNDVRDGRHELNFSDWQRSGEEADEIAEVIRSGEMPPWYYELLHPDAKLSTAEQQALIEGLNATLGSGGGEDSDS